MKNSSWQREGTMAKAERDALLCALEANSYRITSAARRLEIGRTTVYRLIAEFEIPIPHRLDRERG